MRVVFLGTPQTAVPALEALARSGHEVAGVVCQPDRPAHRGRKLAAPPVKDAALALGLPVLQPESLRAAPEREAIASLRPDALVVVAYGRILGPKTLAIAAHGAINLHFSLLPRWRGAAPVQRAILAGDATTGVSIFRLVQELDAGPVLAAEASDIGPHEHAPSVLDRLAVIGSRLLVATLDAMEEGAARERPQDESLVTLAPPLSKDEGRLDPEERAIDLERRVRALDPWPGTRLALPGGVLGVLEARADEREPRAAPGTLLPLEGDALPLACRDGVLLLATVKPEGRAAMTARAAVNGRHLVPGQRATPAGG